MNNNKNLNEEGFNWPVVIKNPNPRANLDYYYGPYTSLSDLENDSVLPSALKTLGFTAAVKTDDGIAEYWWTGSKWEKKGVESTNIVRLVGIVDSVSALDSITSKSNGDMYLVKDGDEYKEYIWVDDKASWELLGSRTSQLNSGLTITGASGALTVGTSANRSSGTYDGSQAIQLDMSGFLTSSAAQNTYISKTDAASNYVSKTNVKVWDFKNGTGTSAYGNKIATLAIKTPCQRATLIIAGKQGWNGTNTGATWIFQISQNYQGDNGVQLGVTGVMLHGMAASTSPDVAQTDPSPAWRLLAKWESDGKYSLYWIPKSGCTYYSFTATFISVSGYTVTEVSGSTGILSSSDSVPTVDGKAYGVLEAYIGKVVNTALLDSTSTSLKETMDTKISTAIANLGDTYLTKTEASKTYATPTSVADQINTFKTIFDGVLSRIQGVVVRTSNGDLYTVSDPSTSNDKTALNVNIDTTGKLTSATSLNAVTLNLSGYGYSSSDARLKKNVQTLGKASDMLGRLRVVSFEWNEDAEKRGGHTDGEQGIGFIAQEAEEAGIPGLVSEMSGGYKGVDYERVVPLLVKETQELRDVIEKQKDELKGIHAMIQILLEQALKKL